MCGWQVKLCDLSLARTIPERLRGELLTIKRKAPCRKALYVVLCEHNCITLNNVIIIIISRAGVRRLLAICGVSSLNCDKPAVF